MNHLGISAQLSKIASSLAVEPEVPVGDTRYGTAGDRGLLHPELVMSATEAQQPDIQIAIPDHELSGAMDGYADL
jgi:D-lactate dehydrogenase